MEDKSYKCPECDSELKTEKEMLLYPTEHVDDLSRLLLLVSIRPINIKAEIIFQRQMGSANSRG